MSNGQFCKCSARNETECACGADWTTDEVYTLRADNERLQAEKDAWQGRYYAADGRVESLKQDRDEWIECHAKIFRELQEVKTLLGNKCAENAALQAKIDALMLEHCPDEMTPEQMAELERHQKPVIEPTKQAPVGMFYQHGGMWHQSLEEHTEGLTALYAKPSAPAAHDEHHYPAPLSAFQAGQWWVKELDALSALPGTTADQKRAIALVHHLLASVAKHAATTLHTAPLSVNVARLNESNGRVTWAVFIAKSPDAALWDCHQVYSDAIEGRARYTAAELSHFLGLGPKPDILAFDTDPPPERCPHCDGSGDAHDAAGEWRCYCTCPAGVKLKAPPKATTEEAEALRKDAERYRWLRDHSHVFKHRRFQPERYGNLDKDIDAAMEKK